MDRFNLRAQKDDACGIGTKNDEWRFAVDQIFNTTYWPYIQSNKNSTVDSERYYCIRKFFADSYDSLILESARFGIIVSSTAVLLGAIIS